MMAIVTDNRAPAGAFRRRLSAQQRQRNLLYAGAEVFARRGYDGARIEEIAEAAGVAKSMIYNHFSGKRELYVQIRSTGTAESLSRVLRAAQGGDAKQRMERALNAFLDFVEEQPLVWQIIQQEVSDPELVALDGSQQRRSENAIAALLASDERIAGRHLAQQELDLLGVMINGACVRAADWWLQNPELRRSELVARIMDVMWPGIESIRERRPST
jgi:AcrR family transcriptional regulator